MYQYYCEQYDITHQFICNKLKGESKQTLHASLHESSFIQVVSCFLSYFGYCTEELLTGHGCQMVGRLLMVLFLIRHGFIRKNNNSGEKMPYVTNPYLIRHHSTAVTRQFIKTMEMGCNQAHTLDQCFKYTMTTTTAQLFTLSGLQTAEGRGAPFPRCLGTHTHTYIEISFSLLHNY